MCMYQQDLLIHTHFLTIISIFYLLQHKYLCSTKSSLTFWHSRQHSQSWYLIPHILHFLLSSPCLHLILWISSQSLSTMIDLSIYRFIDLTIYRFDNELAINLVLSINYNMHDVVFVTSPPFNTNLFNIFCYWNWKGFAFFSIFS